jgi:hypothetical protein
MQKCDKYGHIEASGRGKEPWAHLVVPLDPKRMPLGPQVAMPHHRSMGAAPDPMTSVHSSQFDQWTRFDDGGSMGPLS